MVAKAAYPALDQLDFVGLEQDLDDAAGKVRRFIRKTEKAVGRRADWLGFSGTGIVERPSWQE